jgi:hypothetical protein
MQGIVSNRLDRNLMASGSIYHHNALHALRLIEGSEFNEWSHDIQRHSSRFDMPEGKLRRIDIDLASVKEHRIPRNAVYALGCNEDLRRAIRNRHTRGGVVGGDSSGFGEGELVMVNLLLDSVNLKTNAVVVITQMGDNFSQFSSCDSTMFLRQSIVNFLLV